MCGEVIGGNVTQAFRKCWVSSDIMEAMRTLKTEYAGELPSAECVGN